MYEEKLVRDGIPDAIRRSGRVPELRVAAPDEMDILLRRKIVEEAGELLDSGDDGELVDILEAISCFANLRMLNLEKLDDLRHKKRATLGGFEKGYVLRLAPVDES